MPHSWRNATAGVRGAMPRIANAVFIGIVVVSVSEVFPRVGLRVGWTTIVLAVVWLAMAVDRVIASRRHSRSATIQTPAQAGIAAMGVAPWLLVPVLAHSYPQSALWRPLPLAPWTITAGIVLGIAVTLVRPLVKSRRRAEMARAPLALPDATVDAQLVAVSMLLTSASPFIAVLVGLWLVSILVRRAADAMSRARRIPVSVEHQANA